MTKFMACILSLQLLGLAWVPSAYAQAAAPKPVLLETIEVADDQVNIKLTEAPQYNSFLTANPPRLVIELLNTEYQAGAKAVEGKGRFVKRVRSGQFQRTPSMVSRIVVDLNEVAGYKVEEQAGGLAIKLVAAEVTGPDSQTAETPAAAPAALAAAPVVAAVEKPKVAVSKPKTEAGSMSTENNPELNAMAESKSAGDSVPINKTAPVPTAKFRTPGSFSNRSDIMSRLPKDPVSMDFDSMDIRDILSMLAQKAKINIIYGNDVSGTLTLHLNDVPFSEAFRTILTMMNLTTMQVGESILRVLTPAELARSRSATTAVTKIIPLNYSKASDLATAINAVRTAEGRSGATTPDVKTNSLIVTESIDSMLETERLISQLDIRPKQVLIEAKLIEVGLTNSLHYGIQWDYLSSERGRALGKEGVNLVGTTANPAAASSPVLNPLDNNAFAIAGGGGATGRGTGVSLPASSVFGALTLGRITNSQFISATLTAAASAGKVKVLSDPKIATMNNVPANINVTSQFPYVTSNVTATGVTSQQVAYVTTGIELVVTPTINADGRITLDINPKVSQPSATTAASVTGAPGIDSRNAKTIVIVKDGETIVIGGLISDSQSNQIAKIPILGDIPVLGWLFRKKSVVRTRSELLIFVTPKIMPD